MIVGIDCGVSGAAAWVSDEGFLVTVEDMPVTEVQVGKTKRKRLVPAMLAKLLADRRPVHVFIEEVGTKPGEGAVGAFSFGRGFGQVEGVITGMGIPVTLVRPQRWKKHLHIPADKDQARLRAMQLWPGASDLFGLKKFDGRAEAALIALYGCHVMAGDTQSVYGRHDNTLSVPVGPMPLRRSA